MKNCKNLNGFSSNSIGQDKRSSRDNKLSRRPYPAWPAYLRMTFQLLRGHAQPFRDACCSTLIVLFDISPDVQKILQRLLCPKDLHLFRVLRGFGAGSSFAVPHEANQVSTSSPRNNNPSSACRIPFRIWLTCHDSSSTYRSKASVARKDFDLCVASARESSFCFNSSLTRMLRREDIVIPCTHCMTLSYSRGEFIYQPSPACHDGSQSPASPY